MPGKAPAALLSLERGPLFLRLRASPGPFSAQPWRCGICPRRLCTRCCPSGHDDLRSMREGKHNCAGGATFLPTPRAFTKRSFCCLATSRPSATASPTAALLDQAHHHAYQARRPVALEQPVWADAWGRAPLHEGSDKADPSLSLSILPILERQIDADGCRRTIVGKRQAKAVVYQTTDRLRVTLVQDVLTPHSNRCVGRRHLH